MDVTYFWTEGVYNFWIFCLQCTVMILTCICCSSKRALLLPQLQKGTAALLPFPFFFFCCWGTAALLPVFFWQLENFPFAWLIPSFGPSSSQANMWWTHGVIVSLERKCPREFFRLFIQYKVLTRKAATHKSRLADRIKH